MKTVFGCLCVVASIGRDKRKSNRVWPKSNERKKSIFFCSFLWPFNDLFSCRCFLRSHKYQAHKSLENFDTFVWFWLEMCVYAIDYNAVLSYFDRYSNGINFKRIHEKRSRMRNWINRSTGCSIDVGLLKNLPNLNSNPKFWCCLCDKCERKKNLSRICTLIRFTVVELRMHSKISECKIENYRFCCGQ